MRIKIAVFLAALFLIAGLVFYSSLKKEGNLNSPVGNLGEDFQLVEKNKNLNSLTVESLREREYPGSDLTIEQTLESGSNYSRYIAAYYSEGNKIYGLLTVPNGENPPVGGWPAIIFNHGYIPPKEYQTTEKYVGYVDGFARNGYIVFKPDYRGHGSSQGEAVGAYGSNAYTTDVLNALSSVKKYQDVNPQNLGMWGHSLGGFLTLRVMVVSKDVKAGVIWAGVVGSYEDLINNWRRRGVTPPPGIPPSARRWRDVLIEQYGTPEKNPMFWNSLSANFYLADISGPLQLHHGNQDTSVPILFSEKLFNELESLGKEVEYYSYSGDDHNLAQSFNLAMQRSIEFFDKNLK